MRGVQGLIYGAKRYEKHYVSVLALHHLDGNITPVTIIWDDGRRLGVTVLKSGRRQRCDHTSGYAIKYPVTIKGKTRVLWRDNNGWFVECKEQDELVNIYTDPRLGFD